MEKAYVGDQAVIREDGTPDYIDNIADEPEKAIDLLCTTAHKFKFDEHGLADMYPFPYFPANGGLLTAVAMMCAGWDGLPKGVPGSTGESPGFPKDGSWVVRYEGFNRMM